MEKLFYPESIVIIGLSSKPSNIPRLVLENLIRWGYMGRIFGVNPSGSEVHVNGIRMYRSISELPIVPDLAFALIPARFIPDSIDECGRFGIKRMAIPSGGFNELGEEGKKLAKLALDRAGEHGIVFVGPNGVTIANTSNGLCLPFVPSYSPPKGGLSIISQSGGVGLMLWNFLTDENIGMAKFASIGNKLMLDEVDFLEYFGKDPETEIIFMYLESIPRGEDLVRICSGINKPVVILKSNVTDAGGKAAMSHTAALKNNDDIINAAFERVGIIRIDEFREIISVAKAFKLPPLRGKKLMVMSPAGGFTVMMADRCESMGFEFADPGRQFYDDLKKFSNAGVINFSNPLDMGDIYDPVMTAHILYTVMHNENIDGAIYVSQWPHMPRGEDVFYRMFHTDLSKDAIGAILSSGKPIAACLFGLARTISRIKQTIGMPIFDSPGEMIGALKKQYDYYQKKTRPEAACVRPDGADVDAAKKWISERSGIVGEDALDLLATYGIRPAESGLAATAKEASSLAEKIGYPVVMKVSSPDAVHKSEAGGVVVGIADRAGAEAAFERIRSSLAAYKKDARFDGVRVMKMAGDGYDMFIGGNRDESFGPVVFFGFGGIYIEIFRDVKNVLCPSLLEEISEKLKRLKSYAILRGARGRGAGDIAGYAGMIERVTHLMSDFPQIKELDINPVRILEDGSGVVALDARMRIA